MDIYILDCIFIFLTFFLNLISWISSTNSGKGNEISPVLVSVVYPPNVCQQTQI